MSWIFQHFYRWLYALIPQRPATAWRPRVATILFAVNLVVLLVPVGGLLGLRLYESSLVRQTETGLKTQAVLIGKIYEASLRRFALNDADFIQQVKPVERLTKSFLPTLTSRLDLATETLQEAPPLPVPQTDLPENLAIEAGTVVKPLLTETQSVTQTSIHVVDQNGRVVASTSFELGTSIRERPEVLTALRGRTAEVLRRTPLESRLHPNLPTWISFFSRSADLRIHVVLPILTEEGLVGAVALSRSPDTLLTALSDKQGQLLIMAIVIMSVIIFLAIFTALTISQPVGQLIDQARRAISGEMGAVRPLVHPVTRELAELSDAVATLASTLEQRADYIRSFAAQLSHELKSPLTSMRGAIELMEDDASMTPARRAQFLANVNQDVDRLTRIMNSILDLARAEADKGKGRQSASLADAIDFVMSNHSNVELYDAEGLCEERVKVRLSEDELYAILKNLTENAFQHGATHVSFIMGRSTVSRLWLQVLDNGPGVSEGNLEKIFDPFFTTDRNQGGTGLGLPLVASLMEGIGGSVTYVPGFEGACFELEFPFDSGLVLKPR